MQNKLFNDNNSNETMKTNKFVFYINELLFGHYFDSQTKNEWLEFVNDSPVQLLWADNA